MTDQIECLCCHKFNEKVDMRPLRAGAQQICLTCYKINKKKNKKKRRNHLRKTLAERIGKSVN